jgi:hypothetical protein
MSCKNVIGSSFSTTFLGSTDCKLGGASGIVIKHQVDTITAIVGSVSPSTMSNNGVTVISTSAGDSTTVYITLASPIKGCEKTIIVLSTATNINPPCINLNGALVGNSAYDFIAFSSLAVSEQAITLIGLSTSQWAVKSVNSTLGGFGVATGIVGLAAASSSG